MKHTINIKRAYEPASTTDGYRVYVDRLWPRGLSHETFHYDLWYKEIAPSTALREWFHENPSSEWIEFENKYNQELKSNPAIIELIKTLSKKPVITLLYSSKDNVHNNAIVLKNFLLSKL